MDGFYRKLNKIQSNSVIDNRVWARWQDYQCELGPLSKILKCTSFSLLRGYRGSYNKEWKSGKPRQKRHPGKDWKGNQPQE